MMRKIFFLLFMILMVQGIAAQKKDISTAKAYIKSGKNLDTAEQLMVNLLRDSTHRANDKIWLTLFDAIHKEYAVENEKMYLKQTADTAKLFSYCRKMFLTLEGLDSLDAKPNNKGKVELKYRNKHAQFLNTFRPNLFNGGTFFINKQKYKDAYQFFDTYLDCAEQPLFRAYHYQEKDQRLPLAAYWAVFCGYKMKDSKATLKYTYTALKDTAHYNYMLQYLAETYKQDHDTARYVDALKEGFQKYPKFPFFFPRLVEYYSDQGQLDRAMEVCNQGLAVDSASEVFLFAKSTVLLNSGKYDECIAICDRLLAKNDSLTDAYLNAGLAYYDKAVELDKHLKAFDKRKQQILDYYKKAMPYLQKYRVLAPEEKDKWALPLYTIYLNLNMGKEFDEIDKLLKR